MKNRRSHILLTLCASAMLALPLTLPAEEATKESSETGKVIFYRTKSMKGGAVRLNISDSDQKMVGLLTNGSKIETERAPGEHSFYAISPSIAGRDSVTITVEAEKTYYVPGQKSLSWMKKRLYLILKKLNNETAVFTISPNHRMRT
ncbi:MAG: hypothetical protein V3V05_12650 [Pontiella sp.]